MKKKYLFVLCLFFFLPQNLQAKDRILGAVATQHPLATGAAVKILQQGGNAMDAAVAAAFTLAVVEPFNSGLGAGGMALIWDGKKRKAFALDFRETAPGAATPDLFSKNGVQSDASREGPLAIAVPGELAGLAAIHKRWGRLPWSSLLGDGIQYAEKGFTAGEVLRSRIKNRRSCLVRDYHSYQIYKPFFQRGQELALETKAKPPPQEENPDPLPPRLIQKDLAGTLKKVQQEGAAALYSGDLGRTLVANLLGKGAILQISDLKNYQVIERAALVARFPFGKVWGMPLPTSGGIAVLQTLNTLEAIQKKQTGFNQNNWLLWLVRVLGPVFQLRNEHMGDPDFTRGLPQKKWVSKSFGRKLAKQIQKNVSMHRQDPEKTALSAPPIKEGHTTHLSVLDSEGNAVSMTLTLNLPFGSCITAGSTGIMMNDEMDDFSTHPGQANAFGLVQSENNAIAGGKRPLSSMSPTLVTRKKKVILAMGSPGGPRIITSVLQALVRYFFFAESLRDSIVAPRLHFQGIPSRIDVEAGFEAPNHRILEALPYPIQDRRPWSNVQAVAYDPASRTYTAISDPRGIGRAEVVLSKAN